MGKISSALYKEGEQSVLKVNYSLHIKQVLQSIIFINTTKLLRTPSFLKKRELVGGEFQRTIRLRNSSPACAEASAFIPLRTDRPAGRPYPFSFKCPHGKYRYGHIKKEGEYSLLKVMTGAMVWQSLSEKILAVYQANAHPSLSSKREFQH